MVTASLPDAPEGGGARESQLDENYLGLLAETIRMSTEERTDRPVALHRVVQELWAAANSPA